MLRSSVLCRVCSQTCKAIKSQVKTSTRFQSFSSSLAVNTGENATSIAEEAHQGPFSNNASHPYENISPWKAKKELAEYLCTQIVHSNDGLVIINKPFGVGVTNPKGQKKLLDASHLRGVPITDYTLEECLPYIRNSLNQPELVLIKSAEKMTSGIAVFAENLKHAEKFQEKLRLSNSLSHTSPLYTYLVITARTPYENKREFHERVGIRLASTALSDFKQPVVTREFSHNAMMRGDVRTVWVNTKVLSYGSHKTCFLEIRTSKTRWNFLRVYCADLLLPILGDHLYSCRVQTILGVPAKIDIANAAPGSSDQRLSPEILQDLQVNESIGVPPHIHLSSYSLRNYRGKGQHLELFAPLPPHYEWTKQQLKLQ